MGGSINQNVLANFEIENPLDKMMEFAYERQLVFHRKEAGLPFPWSDDPAFTKFKFCNIFRDQDKTTKWIVNWVKPINNPKSLFENLIYARMCNNPDVMSKTGWIGTVSPDQFIAIIDSIGGGKTPAKVNKNTVWKDPYQIAGAFKNKLGLPYREHVIAYHLPKVSEELYQAVVSKANIENLEPLLDDLAKIWGYKMTMVFTHALLDLSYFRPDLVNPNASYPMGDGAKPILKILNNITLDEIVKEWNSRYPKERKLLRADAEGMLCEWRKYLVWTNNLAKKYRLYKPQQERLI